jgi:molybdopterin converting factor small subunit
VPKVFIPPLWQELTGGLPSVEVRGSTVRQAIDNLEKACPGIRDRVLDGDRLRPNVRVAVNDRMAAQGLRQRVSPSSEIHFIAAISGG